MGEIDLFVAKLSSTGSWQWAVKAGGLKREIGYSIIVDSSDNVYVTGEFEATATWHDRPC